MSLLPSGTVTFLFTDIEGSTRLWQSHPHPMKTALARHDEILRNAIEANGGYVFKTVGDAFCGAFHTAMDGLNAALRAQLAIRSEIWDSRTPIRVRMAIHTGEAIERNNDYYGPALNRTARLESIGYGGQTLVSLVSAELVRDMLPDGVGLKEMGQRRLKDLTRPEAVYQLVHPGLQADFPPLKSIDLHPHNLPVQPAPLIGREKTIEKLCAALTAGGARLVTLTGTGGIGKTRLALQIAAELVDRFTDGAFFFDLTAAKTAAEAAAAVARVFKLREDERRGPVETVVDFLLARNQLLVLDNLEQIPDAGAFVARLLAGCDGIRLLATSREPLRLKGERKIAVEPLPAPERNVISGLDVTSVSRYESVRLFIERARAVDDDFVLDERNAPAVAEICARLDGIPLALELAAARINVLGPEELLERLNERFKILTHGAYDLPQRQQTLRNTIDWSYNLLDEQLKIAFAALSFFAGGFTMDAAEAVLPAVTPAADALDCITSLFEKSLLLRHEGPSGPRFDMLESLRLYAAQRAADLGLRECVLPVLADYFLSLCNQLSGKIEGENQATAVGRYTADYDNIRIAYRRLFETDDPRCAEMMVAMWQYCKIRGHYTETRKNIDEILKRGFSLDVEIHCRLLDAAGLLAERQGYFEESRDYLQHGLRMVYATGHSKLKHEILRHLGWTYEGMNKLRLAHLVFTACERSARASGDMIGLGAGLNGLGHIAMRNNQKEEAKRCLSEGIRTLHRHGGIRERALIIGNYGLLMRFLGDRRAAIKYSKKAIQLLQTVDERDQIKYVYINLASMHEELGEYDIAIDHWETARKLAIETADRLALSNAQLGISRYHLERKDYAKALAHAEAALETVDDMRESCEYGMGIRVLAEIQLCKGERRKAEKLFKNSIAILENKQEPEELALATAGLEKCKHLREKET